MTDQPAAGVALKPCPFCGATAKIVERGNPMSKWRWSVDCTSTTCGMSGPVEDSELRAVTAWNARTPASGAVEAETMQRLKESADAHETLHSGYAGSGWVLVVQNDLRAVLAALTSSPKAEGEAVPVTIFCPVCAVPHVDEGEWATTRKHKTHQCQGCGHEWRPFPFATVGVPHPAPQTLQGGEVTREMVIAALEPFALLVGYAEPDASSVILSDPIEKWLTYAQLHDAARVMNALISPAQREGEG